MEQYDFEQRFEKLRPLLRATGINSFGTYADLISTAVKKEHPDRDESLYWQVWRPWIGADGQFGGQADVLLSALRDDALAIARESPDSADAVAQELIERSGVFERVGHFVLAELPRDLGVEAAIGALTNQVNWTSRHLSREFAALAEARRHLMSQEQLAAVLRSIAGGPLTSPDDDERFPIVWRYRRLNLLAGLLGGQEAKELTELEAEFGPLDPPASYAPVTARWVGPTSPVASDVLVEGGPTLVLDWLLNWKPTEGWAQPTPEGLSRELAKAVADEPELLSGLVSSAEVLHPTYLRGIFDGIRQGAQQSQDVPWAAVLELARHVTQTSRRVPIIADDDFDADRDWTPARRAVLWAIRARLTDRPVSVDDARTMIEIIEPLLDDPEPDALHEAEFGGSNMDWATLALNTVRPLAVLTSVDLAASSATDSALLGRIQERLRRPVDPRAETALSVRAALGQSYPSLRLVWPMWTSEIVDQIFPVALEDAWWAAWSTYLSFFGPSPETFHELRPSYNAALERFGQAPDWRYPQDPNDRLAEHLVIGFANDWIQLDDPLFQVAEDRKLEPFWTAALRFAGRAVTNQDLPPQILDNLRRLWDVRRAAFEAGTASENEMAQFGWWFPSQRMPSDWLLENLQWVLATTPLSERSSWAIVDRLVSLVDENPTAVFRSIGLLTEAASEPWEPYAWRENLRELYRRTKDLKADGLPQLRFELAGRLATRGMLEFRELAAAD